MTKSRTWDNPYILMAILMLFWGSFSAVNKLVLNTFDSFQMLFYTFGFVFLILTIYVSFGKKFGEFKVPATIYLKLALVGLTQLSYYFFYSLSLDMIPAIEASMINYLFPLFIVLFAVPIHGEKMNAIKIISLAVSFAGVVLIITGGNINSLRISNLLGDFYALMAAVSWGVFSNLSKKYDYVSHHVSNYVYTAVAFIFSIILVLLFSPIVIPNVGGVAGSFWMSLNILMTYFLWFKVLRIAPSSLVASLSFFTPFVTLIFIVVLLGEKITVIHLLGAVIILAGTAINNLKRRVRTEAQ